MTDRPDVDQMIDIGGEEGLGLHRRQQFGGVDRLAVMADAACGFGEFGRQPRLARRDQRPAVDEDLRADLLGDRLPVGGDRAGKRRRDAAFEVQPGRMFGRIAVAAPPQDRALSTIELSHVLPISSAVRSAVTPCSASARTKVKVPDTSSSVTTSGAFEAVMDVIFDRSELLHDALIGPAFEWPAEIDADQLAEDAGVDAFEIVGGNMAIGVAFLD